MGASEVTNATAIAAGSLLIQVLPTKEKTASQMCG
jgi:redox-regulated HSP33 family molecular chaperone